MCSTTGVFWSFDRISGLSTYNITKVKGFIKAFFVNIYRNYGAIVNRI